MRHPALQFRQALPLARRQRPRAAHRVGGAAFAAPLPGKPHKEERVWDRVSSCPSCVLAGGGSPEGLGKVAGAARGGSGQPSVQSSFALGRW